MEDINKTLFDRRILLSGWQTAGDAEKAWRSFPSPVQCRSFCKLLAQHNIPHDPVAPGDIRISTDIASLRAVDPAFKIIEGNNLSF